MTYQTMTIEQIPNRQYTKEEHDFRDFSGWYADKPITERLYVVLHETTNGLAKQWGYWNVFESTSEQEALDHITASNEKARKMGTTWNLRIVVIEPVAQPEQPKQEVAPVQVAEEVKEPDYEGAIEQSIKNGKVTIEDCKAALGDYSTKAFRAFMRLLDARSDMQYLGEGVYIVKFASQQELPALQGSEKQIKWANDIRLSAIGECMQAVQEVREKEGQEQAEKVLAALYTVLAYPRFLRADYWITRRNSRSWGNDLETCMRHVLIGRVVESDKV